MLGRRFGLVRVVKVAVTVAAAVMVALLAYYGLGGDRLVVLLVLYFMASAAMGLVIPTTLQGTGLAFLSMGFDIKGPTYVNDTIHVEIEVTEIKPTSKDPSRALVRTTNLVKNQKGDTVLVYTPLRMMQGR